MNPTPAPQGLTDALRELLEAEEAPYPPFEAGQEAQTAWAVRRQNARDRAREVLATRQTGGVDQAWVEHIRAEERERCATVCEALGKDACGPDGVPNDAWASAYKHVADDCAQSIRASTALGAKGKS